MAIPAGYDYRPFGGYYKQSDASGPYAIDSSGTPTLMGGSSGSGTVTVAFAPATTVASASGSITLGGTAQNAAAANANRKGYWVQNQSSGDLWINTLAAAVLDQPSLKIPAGGYFETPPGGAGTGAISIIGATTGQKFAAREW